MNLWQAILVHTLAASLLVAGVGPCPCVGVASGTISGSANSCGMNHATGSGQLLLLLLDAGSKQCDDMPCFRRQAPRTATPADAPASHRDGTDQPIANVGLVALLPVRSTSPGNARGLSAAGLVPNVRLTLQSQCVRIQT